VGLDIRHEMEMERILSVEENGLDERDDGPTRISPCTNNGDVENFTFPNSWKLFRFLRKRKKRLES
jgi:hypothetical protein